MQSLTVPLKVTGSAGVHWIMAPLKCDPLAGKMQLQVSNKTTSTGIILNVALILASSYAVSPCYTTEHQKQLYRSEFGHFIHYCKAVIQLVPLVIIYIVPYIYWS